MLYSNGSLDDLIKTIEIIKNNVTDAFDSIKATKTSISSNWSGDASDAFITKYNALIKAFDSYEDALSDIKTFYYNANKDIKKVESTNTNIV